MGDRERARKSKKQVLQKAFLETIKLSKHLILKKKESLKKKHLERLSFFIFWGEE